MASNRGGFRTNTSTGAERSLVAWKEFFFDRQAVADRVQKAKIKILSRMGAYVRRRAQTSMRRRKLPGASSPGSPPFARIGWLRENILFAYDPDSDSVVTGILAFPRSEGGQVPATHEYGGTLPARPAVGELAAFGRLSEESQSRILTEAQGYRGLLRDFLRQRRPPEIEPFLEPRERHYPARPTMRPALERELPKFGGLFRDSV